jgi:hypothetical protein
MAWDYATKIAMTTEIYLSTFNRYMRGRMADIAQQLQVDHDIAEVNRCIKAFFPPLSGGRRNMATGCWVIAQPRLNRHPHDQNTGMAIAIRLPENYLSLEEATQQATLLVRLQPLLLQIVNDYQDFRIKDD